MRTGVVTRIVLALLCIWLTPARAQPAPSIPWDRSLTISRTSSGEDVKTALRSLLQAGGLTAVFAPNVEGTVSFRLDKVPVYSAFERLIAENNLVYRYDPPSRTVSIAADGASGGLSARPGAFVPLDRVTYDELAQAMSTFGLSTRGVRYDSGSRTVALSGDTNYVERVGELIRTLETARQRQRERVNTDRARELELRRAELAQQAFEDVKDFEVKVIALRFTDVGPTTKQFQGRNVTIPGIADTLRSILGITDAVPQALSQPLSLSGIAGSEPQAANVSFPLGETQQLGQPRISIDQRTNSVVVQGTPNSIAAVEKIIHELDRPLQMVEIEVVIASADIGVARQLGINWRSSVLNSNVTPLSGAIDTGTDVPQIGIGSNGGFDTTGLDALSLLPLPTTAGQTTAAFVVRGGEIAIQAQLQALAAKDRARILSAPRLVTLDNITARITRSQNIFVQVDTRNPTGGGLGAVGLQEIQTGLTLEITPSIVPADAERTESLVRLNLRAENSSPGAGVFGQIDVKSQEVQTNVLVPDGATFVIGGLFDDTQITNETGVPLLKDIPLIGQLFRSTKSSKTLGETIFFITPHLVDERTVAQDDIAVKVGSEDYVRRGRRTLSEEVYERTSPEAPTQPGASLSTLEEDE